uniref:Anaphase-promoting complex subunit 5 n=1 Tax=Thielaviopsis paradoxa TaxID=13001 RepID=A0A2R4ZT54_9PEZI|nr:TPA_exp: anaphase promoting complex protein 5 [Thielaviopsis paradoxa]
MRLLTPAKVALLVLIDMYVDNEIPCTAHRPVLEFLTLHTMNIDLPLLRHKLSPAKAQAHVSRIRTVEATVEIVASVAVFQQLLLPLASKATGTGTGTGTGNSPAHSLWDVFLQRLWKVNSLNEMHVFIATRPRRLLRQWTDASTAAADDEPESDAEPGDQPQSSAVLRPRRRLRLTANSPFGQFVRTCRVDLQRQTFQQTAQLWQAFITYRQPTAGQMRAAAPLRGRFAFDGVLDDAAPTEDGGGWAADEVRALADVVYGDMLRGDVTEGVAVSTSDIENLIDFQVQRMHSFGCRVPMEIRHQFEDMVRDAKIVPSKTHYLRYLEAWKAGDYTTAFDQVYRFFDYSLTNNDRQSYQMALMTLAVINSDFGCYDDALTAMLEAISTARENGDVRTLNMCLRWLFRFDLNQPALLRALDSSTMLTNMHETFSYLKTKSAEAGMIPLIVSTYFLEAEYGLATGDSLAAISEAMMRACYLIGSKNLPDCFGAKATTASRVWSRMGVALLSRLECDVFLQCGATAANLSTIVQVTIGKANHCALMGDYPGALALVEGLTVRFHGLMMPDIAEAIVRTTRCIRAQQLLSQGRLRQADAAIALLAQQPDGLPRALAAHHFMQLDSLFRRGEYTAALERIDDMLAQLDTGTTSISLQLRLMLCKARIFTRCAKPVRGLTISVRAAMLALAARAVPYLCEAAGLLANVLNSLGEYAAAQHLLAAALPRLLETEHGALVGEMYLVLADAYMGVAGEMAAPPRRMASEPADSAVASTAPSPSAPPSTPPMRATSPTDDDHHFGQRVPPPPPVVVPLTAEQMHAALERDAAAAYSVDRGQAREALAQALWALERALEHYGETGDADGQCEALSKKATALRIAGEQERAEAAASGYLRMREESTGRVF